MYFDFFFNRQNVGQNIFFTTDAGQVIFGTKIRAIYFFQKIPKDTKKNQMVRALYNIPKSDTREIHMILMYNNTKSCLRVKFVYQDFQRLGRRRLSEVVLGNHRANISSKWHYSVADSFGICNRHALTRSRLYCLQLSTPCLIPNDSLSDICDVDY